MEHKYSADTLIEKEFSYYSGEAFPVNPFNWETQREEARKWQSEHQEDFARINKSNAEKEMNWWISIFGTGDAPRRELKPEDLSKLSFSENDRASVNAFGSRRMNLVTDLKGNDWLEIPGTGWSFHCPIIKGGD